MGGGKYHVFTVALTPKQKQQHLNSFLPGASDILMKAPNSGLNVLWVLKFSTPWKKYFVVNA